jgi:hypothetical protein
MRFRYLIATLLALLTVTSGWIAAQAIMVEKVPPTVMTGENVGFRVEGLRGGTTPVGRIVVMVNGRWVEAELASGPGTTPLSTR